MRARCGISRVAVEVIALVIATMLALLLVTPVGQVIFNAIHRAQTTSNVKYHIEILAVNPRGMVPDYDWVPADCRGKEALVVTIKNVGSETINEYRWELDWALYLKNSTGKYLLTPCCLECRGPGDCSANPGLEPGEIWIVYIPSGVQDPSERFILELFGPEGAKAIRAYP